MKNLTAQQVRELYIEYALTAENAMANNDYKTNNKAANQLTKIFKVCEKDIDLAKEILMPLLEHENFSVKANAAADCLRLGICIKSAEEVLEKMSKEKGIIGFNAEICLGLWQKGELK